jgi:hypothetical protein
MPFHLLLLVLALVLLALAAIFEWSMTTEPTHRRAHAMGWAGLAALVPRRGRW